MDPEIARKTWRTLEPIHGFVYFSPDAEREYAYDRHSHVGTLDKALDEGRERGWTIVDMKDDWKVVFPAEK